MPKFDQYYRQYYSVLVYPWHDTYSYLHALYLKPKVDASYAVDVIYDDVISRLRALDTAEAQEYTSKYSAKDLLCQIAAYLESVSSYNCYDLARFRVEPHCTDIDDAEFDTIKGN